MIVSVPTAASIILSAPFDHVITLSTITLSGGGQQKNNNWQYWQLPITNFGQQRLNSTANRSATEDGQVLPHFEHIVSVALMPPCPIAAVF
jgi:hypothetical protein